MATAIAKPGYREFTATKLDGSKVKLSVRLPNQKELQASDLESSGAFNRSLEAGLPTRQRMIRKIRSNGLWSDEQAKEVDALREELGALDDVFRKKAYTEELTIEVVAEKRAKLQNTLADLRSDFESMLAHTADAKSDEARRNFLVACTIEYAADTTLGKTGQRLFGSVSAYLNEVDKLLTQRAAYEYMCVENDMPSEWTEAEEAAAKAEAEAKAKEAEEKAKAEETADPATAPADSVDSGPVVEVAQPAETVA